MKQLALLLSILAVSVTGCQQTPQIPEQYEPAFAVDEFASGVGDDVTELGSSVSTRVENTKSAMSERIADMKDEVSDFTADQFEPMD